MKIKLLSLVILLFVFSQQVFCQWTDSGSSIYTYDRVGIGTNSPQSTLSVVGTARFDLSNQVRFKITDWTLAGPNSLTISTANFAETEHTPLTLAASLFYFHSGDVGIGTNDTKGYKLAVAGSMVAEEVNVKLQSNWPDFVFNDNHNLMSLTELDSFIKTNNHLPDIPSETEVKENGLNLADMNAKLLQKVEELTLYVIEQQKQIDELKSK
jgi:hypothetical protein